jgi:hypothetical protein
MPPTTRDINRVFQRLADEKQLISMGADSFLSQILPQIAKDDPVDILRTAFMCGAFHCHSAMGAMMDEDQEEATEGDLSRMDKLNEEMVEFMSALIKRIARQAS